jgi:hypothetical protein
MTESTNACFSTLGYDCQCCMQDDGQDGDGDDDDCQCCTQNDDYWCCVQDQDGDCQADDGGDNVLLDGCGDIFLVVALDQEHDGGGIGYTSS